MLEKTLKNLKMIFVKLLIVEFQKISIEMKKLLSAPKYLDQILKEGNLSAQEISNKKYNNG